METLCLCAHVPVEPAVVTLSGSFVAVEGQELDMCCFAASSNPPVQIRWWLGNKELNNTVVSVKEVSLNLNIQLLELF